MKDVAQLKVAIVHDWLIGGGAERVVYELHELFPEAPIYTSYCNLEWHRKLDGMVVTGFLQYWPFSVLRKYVGVLRIWWFTHLDFSEFDLVISSSGNGEAKGIRVPPHTTHVCYCHTPTHYYWRHYDKYLEHPGFGLFDPLARLGLQLLVGPLRRWDLKASKRPDYFIANSTHIKDDIKKYYGRDATIIFPPIDISRFENPTPDIGDSPRSGYVTTGRQTPHKRTDIIVQACTELNLPLTVIGRGPEHVKLVSMAGPTIRFDTNASDETLADYLRGAKAYLFASFDDFGIVAIEALAAGTPVIAYKAGGALDYIHPSKTGEFFASQTADSLAETLQTFDPETYDHQELRVFAKQFSTSEFHKRFIKFLKSI